VRERGRKIIWMQAWPSQEEEEEERRGGSPSAEAAAVLKVAAYRL
jgi:hypothetical protein